MRRLYLRDSAPGDVIEDVYVITNKQLSATATGKHFIKAFISDRTSQVTARMWNATPQIFNAMPESGFLRVRGRFENYQNNLQFIIENTWPAAAGSFDVADLMPHTTKDIDQMCQRLFELRDTIRNRDLSAIVKAYLDDEELMNNFCRAPAAMSFHHAFIGGLLEHTLNAMEVADAVCKFYPTLNRDLVLVGIFLHDIAKTWELSYDSAFGYTDAGQLVGHVVKSAIWLESKAQKAGEALGRPVPQPLIDVLQHIILSHHGLPEFGAARTPSTPEAIAVHVIENLDAKLMMALTATRPQGGSTGEGNWTEYVKALNGRLFKPDLAPGESENVAASNTPPQSQPTPQPAAQSAARPIAHSPPHPVPSQPSPPSSTTAGAPPVRPPPAAPSKLVINNPLFETTPARKK